METNTLSKCKKFQANIFNKSKCQNCFRPKEQHSAEALESSKVLRKVSKCGYLFVAPDSFDFTNPMDRTRRWQRRFFVLYDDGELTYSVDENVGTVPQGIIDMNKCGDVHDAETLTSHSLAIAVRTPEKTTFIKGSDKHEIERWFDVLVMYPRSLKTKHRRSPTYPAAPRQPSPAAPAPAQPAPAPDPPPVTRRSLTQPLSPGVPATRPTSLSATSHPPSRRHTYTHPPAWARDEDDVTETLTPSPDVFHTGGSSEQDADSDPGSGAMRSRSDVSKMAVAEQGVSTQQRSVLENVPATYRSVRSMKHRDRAYQEGMRKSNSMHDLSRADDDADRAPVDPAPLYRSRSRDALYGCPAQSRPEAATGGRPAPRSVSAPSPVRAKVTTDTSRSPARGLDTYSSRDPGTASYIVNGRTKNETDEHKMAKSGELAARMGHHLVDTSGKQRHDPYDDLMYMKKGWLLKQHQDQDWSKHWFVLSGSSLRFFKDSQAEETNDEDGCIDIASCYEVCETDVSRNYGFKLKTSQGDHILSAMTSGIRNNWMQAVQKCMETSNHTSHLDYPVTSPSAHHDYSSSHLDYSPASSTRTSSFSSPSRSSSRYSDYPSPQREAPRRHTLNVITATTPVTSPARERSAAPGDAGWSRPSRARRSLDTLAGDAGKTPSGGAGPGARGTPASGARFVSCTWPYDSSSSGASGSEREHTPDSSSHDSRSRRNSNVSQYLEDEEETRSLERTVEEEEALDDVEHNIRRIHRRSLSDHSGRHKPPHFEKFESGSAFDGDQPSPGRSSSASTPRRRPSEDRTTARAPSAKVKEKSRARSPRPRSPPPLEVKTREVPLENMTSRQDEVDSASPGPPTRGQATSARGQATPAREDALVDLLETEVESLKNQLERTRTELTDTKQENHELKVQLRSTHRDRDDLISDLETDKSRYLTQIEDIQDQMEHTTEFFQRKLVEQEAKMAEQDSHADLTKLQVQTLKKQLKEAKENMEAHEAQLNKLQEKLSSDGDGQALHEMTMEKEHLEKTCQDLEQKLKTLEEEVEQLEMQLNRKSQQLNQREQRLHTVQEALENSEQHIVDLERDLEELSVLRAELKVREEKIADLEEELSAVRNQLSEQDQELAAKDDQQRDHAHQLETTFTLERSKLEEHLEELEKQLEMTRRQSTMSDSLNSNMADILREKDETIAQLEEKLIENDSRMGELNDEVAMEIEENTQLQQNLEASYDEIAQGKRDIEQLNKDIEHLEKALEEAREKAKVLKDLEQKQREEIEQARQEQIKIKEQVDALQRENSELRHALEELKHAEPDSQQVADLTRECEEHRSQNDAFKEECAKLEMEMTAANEKVTKYEAELADLKRQHEDDLQKRYEELVEAQQLTTNLQSKLLSAEAAMSENRQLLEENMAAVQPFANIDNDESQSKQREQEFEDLKIKYERSMQEVRRLRNELREAHISIDDMEIASTGVKQQVKAMEADYQQQLALMSSRVQDLTAKLATADKKVRKLEKRASRRESKLKLRRDSLESGEKTSGSSGEAEREPETDIRAPDAEVMALLKAVVNSPDEQVSEVRSLSLSALNTSVSSNNSKLEDSINTEASGSDISLTDPELAAKCKELQERLASSESRVNELAKALELTTPDGQNKELLVVQEQNKKYEQQIIFLTAKLNKSSAAASVEAAMAKRAASKDEQEKKRTEQTAEPQSHRLEGKLNHTQATLEEMQQKLALLVQELGSADVETSTADYTMIISGLRSRLETILREVSSTEEGPQRSLLWPRGPRLNVDDPVKMFAEKLSLEAVLVGEMAHLIRTGQDHMMSEREVYLQEIAEANHRILELEQKVETLQIQQFTKGDSSSKEASADPVLKFSGLLAEKMVLQSNIQMLMERYKEQETIKAIHGKESGEGTAVSMGQEALFKSQLNQKLQGQTRANSVSLVSRVLVHGELTFILNKLRERMADSRTDQERIDQLDHELELSHQRLCERANLMCDGVEAYKMASLDKIAATIVNNKANKEDVDEQIGEMIKRCAAEYRKTSVDAEQLGVMTESIPESRRHTMIEASVQQEVEEAIETLSERCDGGPPGDSVDEAELDAVLQSVCEVLAQKAVIDGHIAYITEQIQQHQQQAPADARAPNPLRRHDSGIIVGGSSMPTSPTAEEISPASSTDGDMTTLASRLTREAAAKRQLALSLQRKNYSPDSIQTQMSKIAADLVNVDVDLIRHRRLISDYAEVIAQEAMFQAQMTYLMEQLRMQHEQRVRELQRQIDTRSPGPSAADEEQVQVLEAEIQRLSTLLADNDDLLQKESANAQQRMEQMEEELQRQEDFFQREISALEQRYKNRLRDAEANLQEARDELDKLQMSSREEAKKHTDKISTLEHDLKKVQSKTMSEKAGPSSVSERKVVEVERQLSAARKENENVEKQHSEEKKIFSAKVSELEKVIRNLKIEHEKEMSKVKEDMSSVAREGQASLKEEVADLKVRLEEERTQHKLLLEKLRAELATDSGGAGSESDEDRVHQLEIQIEGMQADYEQELAVQRAAHRRELTRSKEDLLALLALAEAKSMQVDEQTIRKRYTKEIEAIKQIYDSGFASMEKSHQRVLREMRSAHKRELETLRTEKDQLLIEETKATQAALDAMRKAHEAEVQKERNKFLDAISKTYSNNDVDSIQRQHEDDLELIQNEIRQLSEQLSIKCLENAALEERLSMQTNALAETRSRAHELMARNEELSLRLRQDIERLSKMIKQPAAPGSPFRRHGEPAEVYDLRVALKLKDADKQQLQDEIEALKKQLQGTTEELEDSMERYQELHTEKTRMRTTYEGQLQEMRQRLDDVMDEPDASSSDGMPSERERASAGSPDSTNDDLTDRRTLTPDLSEDGDSATRLSSPRLSSSRALPAMSNEGRSMKRFLWRQRHVQRARSTPGPSSLLRRLSLPVDQSDSPLIGQSTGDQLSDSGSCSPRASRKERSSRRTTVDVNVASQMYQDKP